MRLTAFLAVTHTFVVVVYTAAIPGWLIPSSLMRSSSARTTSLETAEKQVSEIIERTRTQKLKSLKEKEEALIEQGITPNCTSESIVFRREYGDLSQSERLDYINAVKCLQTLPARTPAEVAPGAKSRFDDFIVTHIFKTLTVHYTGNFMPWHRWYIYVYETALRDECGFTGYQPYWDWAKYASAPQDSPIFNGDEYSLGGNGEYIPGHNGSVIVLPEVDGVPRENIQLPPGLGGGFVKTGPFANMSVNLGPVAVLPDVAPNPQPDGLGYNPRGLKRDVGPGINQRYANHSTVLSLLQQPSLDEYRFVSEGVFNTGEIGPHGGGHYTINGDPGGDFWVSPGDPAFYVHHGMMDRMWALWQSIDPENRTLDLGYGPYSHVTWNNEPPSNLTSLSEVIDLGYAGPSITLGELMSTTDGPFCYFYL